MHRRVPGTEAGVPDIEAGVPGTEAGVPGTEAGVPDTKAGVPDIEAGVPDVEAGVPDVEAGVPDVEAGVPDIEAGVPDIEAGVPDVEAGVPDTEAGVPDIEAGVPGIEAGVPGIEAGLVLFRNALGEYSDFVANKKAKGRKGGLSPRAKAETKVGTRASTFRIRRIHEILKKGGRPTASDLAEELEVSTRCITRDISDMRTYHNLPVEVEGRHGGYFYPDNEVAELASTVTMTKGELLAFFVAVQAMEPFQGTRFSRLLRSGLRKILSEVEDVLHADLDSLQGSISFGSGTALFSMEILEALSDAIRAQEEIEFLYSKLSSDGKTERRNVRPLAVSFIQGGWYLLAHDLDRDGADRRFFLGRMSEVRRTGQKFERPKNFKIEKFLEHSIGAFGGSPVRVVLLLTGVQARLVQERQWHATQKLASLSDGSVRVEMTVAHTPELVSWILARGAEIEVLHPPELRSEIAAIVERMMKRTSTK